MDPLFCRGKMFLPMLDKVATGLNARLLGLLQARHIRGILTLLKEHRKENTSTPGLKIAFLGGKVPLDKIRGFQSSCFGPEASWRKYESLRRRVCSALFFVTSLRLPRGLLGKPLVSHHD